MESSGADSKQGVGMKEAGGNPQFQLLNLKRVPSATFSTASSS